MAEAGSAPTPVLEVERLRVSFPHRAPDDRRHTTGTLRAVDDVSFTLYSGRTLGLIGESGCGKSVTAHALLRLVPPPGEQQAERITLHCGSSPVDLSTLDPASEAMRRVRGGEVALVFQDAAASLSPARTVGAQLRETIQVHRSLGRHEADRVAVGLLERVGFRDANRRLRDYPHQLSGGMGQRVAIALALCGEPRVLVADELTTALDRTVQQQIVTLIRGLQADLGMAVLHITHDLGLVEDACDEVAVMYLGRIVESAPVKTLLTRPLHPYTIRLLESVPRIGQRRGRLPTVKGTVPLPIDLPRACAFVPRCDVVELGCHEAVPALIEVEPDHRVRCFVHSPERDSPLE